MKPLRIALYHNLHSGGAKRVVAEQVRYLATKHHVVIFSLESADHHFATENDSASVETVIQPFQATPFIPSPFGRFNPLIGLHNVVRLDRLARNTAKQIDAENFDVVLVHPCQFTQAPLILRWLRTPTLYYCHELPRRFYESMEVRSIAQQPRFRQYLRRKMDRIDPLPKIAARIFRNLDHECACVATQITVNSRTTQANVWNAYKRRADICFPGVNVATPYPNSTSRSSSVLSVGALTRNKGFDFIIRALATIPAATRPPLLIVSNYQEPDELEFLSQLAQELHVQLELRCNVTDAELQSLYHSAGCVAYAPIREPLGLVALEAMAAGAPVVGVDEGGVRETVVDGVSGLLAPRDPNLFGHLVNRILHDSRLSSQLSQNAHRHVLEHWTWEHHICKLEHLLQQSSTHSRQQHT